MTIFKLGVLEEDLTGLSKELDGNEKLDMSLNQVKVLIQNLNTQLESGKK